jgi:ABC-type uncharacterized transport system substrate-binding protein
LPRFALIGGLTYTAFDITQGEADSLRYTYTLFCLSAHLWTVIMKIKKSLVIAVGIFVFVASPFHLIAHPHAYIANRFTVFFDDQGLAGIQVNWVFDKFFSAMILEDYDGNQNGVLEPAEVKTIKKEAFSFLANHGYFVHIKIDGQPFEVKFVNDFTARTREGALIYEFTVPCHVRAVGQPKQVRVAPYDPTFYTLILFAETETVQIKGGGKFKVDHKIEKNPAEAYYNGMVEPYEMALEFCLKNG